MGSHREKWHNFRCQLVFNSFIRPTNIVVLIRHLPSISLRYWPRALLIATSSVISQPLRFVEAICYGRRIKNAPMNEAPIFIIGHWRSGTTHLHNLFSQDRSLGWLTMYQAVAPDCSLIGGKWLRNLLARVLPVYRPMDNMTWPIDSPQEEEIALAKTTPYSFYSQFMFPRQAQSFFSSYVLLKGASDRVALQLRSRYLRILRIAAIHSGGKRLVLKNPVNTARIRMLVELFPNAKFVHIHRSPYEVYASTRNLHHRVLAFTSLQKLDGRGDTEALLILYEQMMRRFFADCSLVPAGNLVDVRFDDLERDPIGEMRRVYEKLALSSFEATEASLRHYVTGQSTYQKNRLELSLCERKLIANRWSFAFAKLGYGIESTSHDDQKRPVDSRTAP